MRLITTFVILCAQLSVFGQYTDSVVTIISERYISLNGGARSSVGGISRTSIKVDLPPNTKSWYYSFSTHSNQSGTNSLNLAIQLVGLLAANGVYSELASYIHVPSGTGSAEIYLLDGSNVNKFINKDDNWGGSFNYNVEGTVFNTKQAVVEIDDLTSGTYYIGLKNPATWDALDIHIEVAAIVDKSTQVTWVKEAQDMLYDELVDNLTSNDFEFETATELASCMTNYIISNYTLEEVGNWTLAQQNSVEKEIITNCLKEENECENSVQAETYGNLGWTYFEKEDFANSIKFSKKALMTCPENMSWVEANVGLSYLVQDSIDLALDYYVAAITSSRTSKFGKEYIVGAIEDLELYKDRYPLIGKHTEIMDLLKLEID